MQQWTLGLPFYGRNIKTGEPKAYYEIAESLQRQKQQQSSQKKDPTAEEGTNNIDLIDSVYFNSHHTLRNKIKLARESGAGGVMIWELGQDIQPFNHSSSLMQAIRMATTTTKVSHSSDFSDTTARNANISSNEDDDEEGNTSQDEL